ncbi:uncharacterized protein LOC106141941 [Amyelois transitella]|uniref:uncharacterized protein LOC106141941 n=1 Tax=Amyelois transitella TaxID=680683 RepID=UPI00298F724A|nr:uncharacterized protein LOC106141941 [Amyelois transitella]
MEGFGRRVTPQQKKKLIELVTRHPKLISCKVSEGFKYKDSQVLWRRIAEELNSFRGTGNGARKTWRQWRKTWHDLRANMKKRQSEGNGELPTSVFSLTPAEQEALGIKNVSSTTNYQETTEFVTLGQDNSLELNNDVNNDLDSVGSFSEPESPPESKVFDIPRAHNKIATKDRCSEESSRCNFNCDSLVATEQKKLQMKQDYLNFKKDYLQQKLKIMQEQADALQSIAKELSRASSSSRGDALDHSLISPK